MKKFHFTLLGSVLLLSISCNKESNQSQTTSTVASDAIEATFGSNIDLTNLYNYENQTVPGYITKDNTNGNVISNEVATLGRVLFYDKNLSANNNISCASCHKQASAFGDTKIASDGINGTTGRHSMRLINARFADESNFFWDERATSLEEQTTMPIQDHIEMGYSGENGDASLEDLIIKLESIDYYEVLFAFAFGDAAITENRMQLALAQFVRSIQSFDSKFDAGRAQVNNIPQNFPNFTQAENAGKTLFLVPPQFNGGIRVAGGAGCAGCHRGEEFDIDPNSRNNGVITSIGGGEDLTNTRSPSLRDLFDPQGNLNGHLMHDGSFSSLEDAIDHYNDVGTNNPNLDRRLAPGGSPQQLNLTAQEVNNLVAFIKTLSGSDVYTNPKWSDPF